MKDRTGQELGNGATVLLDLDFVAEDIARRAKQKMVESLIDTDDLIPVIRCKDCKYFEYNGTKDVDGVRITTGYKICTKWGNNCKTSENGYCFLADKRSDDNEID